MRPAVLLGLAAFLLPARALAADRTVGAGRQYADLDDALAAAAAGDRILVYAGAYTGNYGVTRAVEIRGAESGVILTASTGTVLTVYSTAAGTSVHDLTLRGGTGTFGGSARVAGGRARFEGVVFERGSASDSGGGLYCGDAACTVVRSEFVSNTAGANGGGLAVQRGTAVVTDSTFTANVAGAQGGGASFREVTTATLSDVVFEDNASGLGGGGMAFQDVPSLEVVRAEARFNTSENTGAAFYAVNSAGELRGSLLEDNSTPMQAGAASIHHSDVDLIANVIRRNAAGLGAGAVHLNGTLGGLVRNNVVYGNDSGKTTGGFLLESGVNDFYNNVVAYNTAVYGGGGILVSRNSDAVVVNNTVYGNAAGDGFSDGITSMVDTPFIASNNIAVYNEGSGISADDCPFLDLAYNDAWGNGDAFLNWAGDADAWEGVAGNVAVDPMFKGMELLGEVLHDDVHLSPLSPLIDAGDPDVRDADGSPSDPGAFGGPFGASWDELLVGAEWAMPELGCAASDFACLCLASDGDSDGHGDAPACAVRDCDDLDPARFPGAPESCNGRDDDCDGLADEGLDADGDGFTPCGGDCDDDAPAVSPAGRELCNGLDDDCDYLVDEQDAEGCSLYYKDADGDGFGTGDPACLCTPDDTWRAGTGGDCYDTNARARPGQVAWYVAHRGDGSHDYDCDGAEAPRWTTTAAFDCGATRCSMDEVGWLDDPPACGTTGTWVSSCQGALYVCSPRTSSTKRQPCH